MSDHQDILGSTLDPEALNLGDYIVVSGKMVSNPVIPGPVIPELAPPQASFQTPSYAAPPISSKVKRRGRPVGQNRPCQCTDCQNVSGAERHFCPFPNCGKSFLKSCHLEAHLKNHSGAEPYQCSESGCGNQFVRANDLRRHAVKHTNSRFLCPVCGKRYYREDHFYTHMKKCSETF